MYEEGWDKQGADERTTLSTHTRHTTHTHKCTRRKARGRGRRGGVAEF